MKKYLGLMVLFTTVLVSNSTDVLAIETQDTSRKDLKVEMQTLRENFKEDIKTTRDEAKEKMEAFKAKLEEIKDKKKKEIFKVMLATRVKAFEGFNRVLENVVKTENKVKEQIEKAKALKIDVTQAENNIKIVDTKLTDAKAKILEATTLLSSTTEKLSEADKTKLKELSSAIQKDFKEARMLLNDTVKSLKEAIKTYKEGLEKNTEDSD